MGLIKSANVPTSLSPFSMRDIEAQAQMILARARDKAEQLLMAAQMEAEELKTQARAEGLAEGHREGMASGRIQGAKAGNEQALAEHRDQLTQLLASLTTAATELESRRNELESAALSEVVGLAVAVARRVTKRQGMLDPLVLEENLREAMKLVVHCADVRIACHPIQRKTMEDILPRLGRDWPALKHVAIVEEPSLSPGGCRVHTAHGQIDADLDGQLDRVVSDLLPAAPLEGVAT